MADRWQGAVTPNFENSEMIRKILADLIEHPNSTKREIFERLEMDDRRVFRSLDQRELGE